MLLLRMKVHLCRVMMILEIVKSGSTLVGGLVKSG